MRLLPVDLGVAGEPENALSVPTWAMHFSSVCEFVLAMRLVTLYGERTGDEKWKGVAWGMLPSHASGVCACTYHLFYNQAALAWLVTAQAGLTFLGLCGIKDPARPEVKPAIAACATAGIRVVMITGDTKPTAEAIAKEIGIFKPNDNLERRSFTGEIGRAHV